MQRSIIIFQLKKKFTDLKKYLKTIKVCWPPKPFKLCFWHQKLVHIHINKTSTNICTWCNNSYMYIHWSLLNHSLTWALTSSESLPNSLWSSWGSSCFWASSSVLLMASSNLALRSLKRKKKFHSNIKESSCTKKTKLLKYLWWTDGWTKTIYMWFHFLPPVISLGSLFHHVPLKFPSTTPKLCNDEHLKYGKSLLDEGLCFLHILLSFHFFFQFAVMVMVQAFTVFRVVRVVIWKLNRATN